MDAMQRELKLKTIYWLDLLIKYLVPFFYFSISVAFYLKTYDSAQIKITLLQIVGTVIVALWLIKLIQENKNPFKDSSTITLPLLFYILFGIFSYAHSVLPGTTLDELIRRIMYVSMALIVVKDFTSLEKIERTINWVLIAAFISSFYGIVQYLDYIFCPKVGEMGLNTDALDPFIWRQAFGPRIFSTHGNPNFFGNFLVIVSPIVLAGLVWKRKLNYLVLLLMVVFCLIKTSSKGAYVGFSAGVFIFTVLMLVYFPIGRNKIVKRVFSISVTVIIILMLLAVVKISHRRMDSLHFRVFTWLSTWEMIETHPVIGSGLGTFKGTYPAYRRPAIFHIEGKSNTETDHPEDEFLEVLYDDGIVGFGLFMLILTMTTLMGLKSLKKFCAFTNIKTDAKGKKIEVLDEPRAYYMLGILSAFFGMLFHNLFDVSLRFVSSGIFLWLLIGLICSLAYNNPMPYETALPKLKPDDKFLIPEKMKWISWGLSGLVVCGCAYLLVVFWGYFQADVFHNMGIYHSKRQEWKEALDYYGKTVKLNPNYIMAHYFTGNVYNDRWIEGDAERTLKKYDDVKALAPNYVQVHHQVGNVYAKIGEKYLNESKRLAAENKPAEAKEMQKKADENYKKAIESYEKYWKLDPVFPQNFFRMAWIYIQQNNYAKAEEIYRAALVHNPGFAETYVNLGNICYMQGKIGDAETSYKKALEIQPGYIQVMKNLAVVYDKTNRRTEALKMWQEIGRLSPEDADYKRMISPNK